MNQEIYDLLLKYVEHFGNQIRSHVWDREQKKAIPATGLSSQILDKEPIFKTERTWAPLSKLDSVAQLIRKILSDGDPSIPVKRITVYTFRYMTANWGSDHPQEKIREFCHKHLNHSERIHDLHYVKNWSRRVANFVSQFHVDREHGCTPDIQGSSEQMNTIGTKTLLSRRQRRKQHIFSPSEREMLADLFAPGGKPERINLSRIKRALKDNSSFRKIWQDLMLEKEKSFKSGQYYILPKSKQEENEQRLQVENIALLTIRESVRWSLKLKKK